MLVNPSALQVGETWLFVAAILAGPAAAIHLGLRATWKTDERLHVIVPLVFVGLLGYVTSFVFYANTAAGKVFSIAVVAMGWAAVAGQIKNLHRPGLNHAASFIAPLAFGLGLFYLALLYLPESGRSCVLQSAHRFLPALPSDPILPQIVGDRLYAGESLHPFLADWLVSDRPPLQSGLYLLVLPWLKIAHLPADLGYQCLGTLAQLIWVPAVWLLSRAIGQGRAGAVFCVLIVAMEGFFVINTVFVWPKLLAGGFVAFSGLLLLDPAQPRPLAVVLVAAAAAALGWLAHGGVAFSLLALAPMCLLWHRLPWRTLAAAFAVFVLVALPWALYQKFCDPPGDRLLKYHLAGMQAVDSRSALQALASAYSSLSWASWLASKRANLGVIIGGSFADIFHVFSTSIKTRRIEDFFYPLRSLGALNAAWLLWPLDWLLRRRAVKNPRLGWTLVGWTVLTAVLWALLMFSPASTVLHQGSYTTILVACTLAAVLLLDLPVWLGGAVLGWHVLYFATTWLPYFGTAPLDAGMFFLFLLSIGLIALASVDARKRDRLDVILRA